MPGVPGQNGRRVPERHLEQERYSSAWNTLVVISMNPWVIPGKKVPRSQGHLRVAKYMEGWWLRVWDISQLLGRGEGEFLNPGMRNQESGRARGPSRKPQGSKPLGPEKCHLLKGASGAGGRGEA